MDPSEGPDASQVLHASIPPTFPTLPIVPVSSTTAPAANSSPSACASINDVLPPEIIFHIIEVGAASFPVWEFRHRRAFLVICSGVASSWAFAAQSLLWRQIMLDGDHMGLECAQSTVCGQFKTSELSFRHVAWSEDVWRVVEMLGGVHTLGLYRVGGVGMDLEAEFFLLSGLTGELRKAEEQEGELITPTRLQIFATLSSIPTSSPASTVLGPPPPCLSPSPPSLSTVSSTSVSLSSPSLLRRNTLSTASSGSTPPTATRFIPGLLAECTRLRTLTVEASDDLPQILSKLPKGLSKLVVNRPTVEERRQYRFSEAEALVAFVLAPLLRSGSRALAGLAVLGLPDHSRRELTKSGKGKELLRVLRKCAIGVEFGREDKESLGLSDSEDVVGEYQGVLSLLSC
jgi:hypothetical protein